MPASGSRSSGVGAREQVDVHAAGRVRRPASRRGGPSRAAARRRPAITSSVTRTGTSTSPLLEREPRGAAVLEAVALGVVGMDRAAAARGRRASAAARCASTSCASAARAGRSAAAGSPGRRRSRVPSRVDLARSAPGGRGGPCGRRGARARRARRSGCSARHDAVRVRGAATSATRPPRRRPNRSPSRPGAQQQVDEALRRHPVAELRQQRAAPGARTGATPISREIASMISHSSRASPRGATTASEYWTNGVV